MTREEAIARVKHQRDWANEVNRTLDVEAFDMATKALEQEPRKGHWIGHREHCENLGVMPSGLGAYEWCSNCDCGIDVREWHRNHYNFCPNCGTDMREGKE